jgi:hypothetical protein
MFFERRPTLVVPERLDRAAFTVKNGERLWSWDDANEMLHWLRSNSFATLGLETYQRHGIGWGTFMHDWSTSPPRGPGETWPAFVARSTNQALGELRRLSSRDPSRSRLYFIAFASESEYPR